MRAMRHDTQDVPLPERHMRNTGNIGQDKKKKTPSTIQFCLKQCLSVCLSVCLKMNELNP